MQEKLQIMRDIERLKQAENIIRKQLLYWMNQENNANKEIEELEKRLDTISAEIKKAQNKE